MHLLAICADSCRGIDCGTHGACSMGRCICESAAYSGTFCDNHDVCFGVECGEHGSCVQQSVQGREVWSCRCSSGAYSGNYCQFYDSCFGVDCGLHGICDSDIGGCVCEASYTGERCEHAMQSSVADLEPVVHKQSNAPIVIGVALATVLIVFVTIKCLQRIQSTASAGDASAEEAAVDAGPSTKETRTESAVAPAAVASNETDLVELDEPPSRFNDGAPEAQQVTMELTENPMAADAAKGVHARGPRLQQQERERQEQEQQEQPQDEHDQEHRSPSQQQEGPSEKVVTIKQFLSVWGLAQYEASLVDLGATKMCHLTYVTAEDLQGMQWKPLEIRRFLRAMAQWKETNGEMV